MRILVISRHFPPQRSNTADLLGELAQGLAQRHAVDVIAGAAADGDAPILARVLRVGSPAPIGTGDASLPRRLPGELWFAVSGIAAACLRSRPDVVVAMNEPPTASVIGLVAAAVHRRPFVQICHDLYPDITIALGRRRNAAAMRVWRLLNRVFYGRAASVVVVGRDMVQKLAQQGIPRAKLRYIPAWASPQASDPDANEAERRKRGWEGKFIVMFAGAMSPGHNLDMFPQVAAMLADLPDVLIVLLGGGPSKFALTTEVERRHLRNVQFVERLPKAAAQRLMAVADLHLVTLAPGLWGCGVPSKTYGIMAAGRPFVASVDPGSEPARIAEEFECGFVVPPGSTDALALAIRAARDTPLDEMGRRGHAAFMAHYQRSAAVGAFELLFESLCAPLG